MPKPIWQKAWDDFLQALNDGKFPGTPDCFPNLQKYKKVFQRLAKSLRQTGISMRFVKDLGGSLDNNGNYIPYFGLTESRRLKRPKPQDMSIFLSPLGRCARTLTHEFAHAADLLIHGYTEPRKMEIVAITASYLFAHQCLGSHTSNPSIIYARKWGIGPKDVKRQKKKILAVYRKMNSLIS